MFNYLITAVFTLYIGIFFVLNIVFPKNDFSVEENRNLAKMPEFTIEDVFSGEFMQDFETFITDQFPFRDSFVALKSNIEISLGKTENNDVYISSQNTLIDKFYDPDYGQLDRNISSIGNLNVPIYFSLIPNQSEIYAYKLPKNAPSASQKDIIDYCYSSFENTIDNYSILMEHNDEYIFYDTDHHWTSLGAYYGYVATMQAVGKTPVDINDLSFKNLSTSFNGTIYSKSGVRTVTPDSIDIYTENYDVLIDKGTGLESSSLYQFDKLENKDQYEVFLGGNHPLTVIQGKGEENLLLIKDSYSNCQVPFLLESYKEVHLIDLRFFKTSISQYISLNKIDDVIISYSIANFELDRNLAFLR